MQKEYTGKEEVYIWTDGHMDARVYFIPSSEFNAYLIADKSHIGCSEKILYFFSLVIYIFSL